MRAFHLPVVAFLFVVAMLSACAHGQDKTAHFVAGALVSDMVRREGGTPLQSCAAAFAVGVAKEAYDAKFGGTVDRGDIWATGAGCAITYRF